jgi:hypothetical protein
MKFLFRAEGLPVAGTVVGHSSHGLRSQITLKLRPYVTFGSEMKWVKRALRTMVNAITCFKSTGKYCLMKPSMVTLPFPILKSKGKYPMAEKPSHVGIP